MRRFLRHPAREFAQQASGKPPDPAIAWCGVSAISEALTSVHSLHLMHREAWIKDAKTDAHGRHYLCRIGLEQGHLWGNRDHDMDQETTCGAVGGIKMAHHLDLVFWIIHMHPKLFMELANRRLLW